MDPVNRRIRLYNNAYLIWLLWLLLAAFAISRISVPPGVPEDAGFAQAENQLSVIAASAHPVGSPAHEALASYLESQIRLLGLTPVRQTLPTSSLSVPLRSAEGHDINNIMVRLPGTGTGRAVLVMAHYDARADSPGAGDDGAAVASMLAVLAQMAATNDRLNDLIFLFSDAEEPCLCGARAFVAYHPWAADIGLVLNFEGRGSSGLSLMFETTAGNAELVRHFGEAAVHPATGSLFYEIYRILPNDTDLTLFKASGYPGLNMAFIGNAENYHRSTDSVDNLSLPAFYHLYRNIQALVSHFVNAPLDKLEGDNVVFFDLLSFTVLSYSQTTASLLAVVAAVLLLSLYRQIFVEEQVRKLKIALLVVACPVLLLLPAIGLQMLHRLSLPDDPVLRVSAQFSVWRLVVMLCVNSCIFFSALRLMLKVWSVAEWEVVVLGYWLLLLVASTWLLPGASYLFLWPLLIMVAGFLLSRRLAAQAHTAHWLIRLFAPVGLLVIWSGPLYVLFQAMSLASAAMIVVLASIALGLLSLPINRFREYAN